MSAENFGSRNWERSTDCAELHCSSSQELMYSFLFEIAFLLLHRITRVCLLTHTTTSCICRCSVSIWLDIMIWMCTLFLGFRTYVYMRYSSLIFFCLFNDFLEVYLCYRYAYIGAVLCKGLCYVLFKVSEIQWGQCCSLSEWHYYRTEIVLHALECSQYLGHCSLLQKLARMSFVLRCKFWEIWETAFFFILNLLSQAETTRFFKVFFLKKKKGWKKKSAVHYIMKGFLNFA